MVNIKAEYTEMYQTKTLTAYLEIFKNSNLHHNIIRRNR